MILDDAIRADREGAVEQAAALYENALAAGERTLEAYLNLTVLYWQATDYGFSAGKTLGPEFVARAGARFPELLREADRAFPGNTEVKFWRRYIPWADLGEEFPAGDCQRLLIEDPTGLVPVMHLYAQSRGKGWQDNAAELLQRCLQDGSIRAKYVASVLQGVMKRSAWGKSRRQD